MGKPLNEMTLEELWQLFPICLTEYKPHWAQWYTLEKAALEKALPKGVTLNHIGSTSVDGIWAKPIIDILAQIPAGQGFDGAGAALKQCGYILMSREPNRLSFKKGYTENGFAQKVFHLHLRIEGDNDELYFRDYLIAHSDVAKAYEKLKLGLWKRFEHNREAYTNAKTDFIAMHTKLAKKEFEGRY